MTERDDSSDDNRRDDESDATTSDDDRHDDDESDDDRHDDDARDDDYDDRRRASGSDNRRDEKPWHKNPYVLLGGALLIGLAFALLTWRKPMDTAPASAPEPHASAVPMAAKAGVENVIQGTVLESLQVSRYTYLHLATPNAGEVWAAVPATQVGTGSEVRIRNPQRMEKFTSHTLKRAFEVIYFGVLDGSPGLKSPHGHGAMVGSSTSPHGSPAPSVALPSEPITKASGPNGRTVQQVHAQKKALAGKVVRVRGVVVRATINVMGKTWVHLQDGSGSASDQSNDLTVTMQSQPIVGQVIEVEGKLGTDRDFGSGYSYSVLLEDARLIQEGAE